MSEDLNKKCKSCEHTVGEHHSKDDPYPLVCALCSCGWKIVNGEWSSYRNKDDSIVEQKR